MSRGPGEVMRRALEVVRAASMPLESQEVARQVFGRASIGEVLPHEGASVRRALRASAARGDVEDMGRGWKKRRTWATPEVAAARRAWSDAFLAASEARRQAREAAERERRASLEPRRRGNSTST